MGAVGQRNDKILDGCCVSILFCGYMCVADFLGIRSVRNGSSERASDHWHNDSIDSAPLVAVVQSMPSTLELVPVRTLVGSQIVWGPNDLVT